MTTAQGVDCPYCGALKATRFVALIPHVKGNPTTGEGLEIIPPNKLSTCPACYLAQRMAKYPEDLEPIHYSIMEGRWSMYRNEARVILRQRQDGGLIPLDDYGERVLALLEATEEADGGIAPVVEAEPRPLALAPDPLVTQE